MAKNEKDGVSFFSKNFNILNFLIQTGILLTILSFVFKTGRYYEQVNKVVDDIKIMNENVKELKNTVIDIEKKIHDNDKDKQQMLIQQDKFDKKLDELQKCQRNRKYC